MSRGIRRAMPIFGIAIGAWAVAQGVTNVGLPSWLRGVLVIGGAVMVAQAGIPIARVLFPPQLTRDHADLLGAALGIVGTVYAVVVGFAVIVVWESMGDVDQTIAQEANAVGGLERLSRGFPIEVRRQVQEATRTYARVVVDHEWETMRTGRSSPMANAALVELWGVYTDMPPRAQETSLYKESLTRLSELDDNRRKRLLAGGASVPPMMWMLMYIGGIVTLILAYAFGMWRNWRLHMIVAFLSATIAFSLFLIAVLDGPFKGDMRADPSPFSAILRSIPAPE